MRVPTKLKRRLEALEARFMDGTGLVPYSEEWLAYWTEQVIRLYERPRAPGPRIPIEAFRAVMADVEMVAFPSK
jgi:hypothetical protein